MTDQQSDRMVVPEEAVEALINRGIRNRWYAICPSSFVGTDPIGLQRAGERLVLWRGADGQVHALEDVCPHRGAPLSVGRPVEGALECRYHGVQVAPDGTVVLVPGSPGCGLEGKCLVRAFPTCEAAGAVFAWFGDELHAEPAPFVPPAELVSAEYSRFLCYAEWDAPYLLSIENNVDPMHGTFLHRDSHTMSTGQVAAKFQIRETPTGFVFEKIDQHDVNFDWSELVDTSALYVRLEIPYPDTAGPGGNFGIVHFATPITDQSFAAFWWRARKVSGWERAVWRFLYANRIEERHYAVLEQDREMLERMSCDTSAKENLYSHDLGIVRFRRKLRSEARAQLEALVRGVA
jgi:phenylpropionate dioxygenase-like ring-hydroxylating dioxygenase large terminal subunit